MNQKVDGRYALFAGSSHEELAKQVASELNVDLGSVLRETFPDGEIGIQIQENVRGKDVFLLQSLARRPNHYLMELLIMVDALRRASARSISVVMPYYAYARQDRKDKPRVPITAKLVANLLEKAGVSRLLTMDLHVEQIQGFFDIPVDNLYAISLFIKTLKSAGLQSAVVVSPDVGGNRLARKFAHDLNVDIAIVDKRRTDSNHVALNAIVGNVKGLNVILVDDICSTGATLVNAARSCLKAGAKSVIAVVTHAMFVEDGALQGSGIERIYVTDTIPVKKMIGVEVVVVPSAKLFAKAIDCIVNDKSISSLFVDY